MVKRKTSGGKRKSSVAQKKYRIHTKVCMRENFNPIKGAEHSKSNKAKFATASTKCSKEYQKLKREGEI